MGVIDIEMETLGSIITDLERQTRFDILEEVFGSGVQGFTDLSRAQG